MTNPLTGHTRCSSCGTFFTCGIADGDEQCWCAMMPRIISLEGRGAGSASPCMCNRCLEQAFWKLVNSDPSDSPETPPLG